MLRYDLRFWDKKEKRMIYGAGLSPNQLPIFQHEDGRLEELQGEFVPMICTHQRAVNGYIWEADVIECDVPAFFIEGMPASFVKARGVMQYNQAKGSFTVNIMANAQMQGQEFKVTNSRIIGCAVSNPELLQVNPNQNEQITEKGTDSSESEPTTQKGKGRSNESA